MFVFVCLLYRLAGTKAETISSGFEYHAVDDGGGSRGVGPGGKSGREPGTSASSRIPGYAPNSNVCRPRVAPLPPPCISLESHVSLGGFVWARVGCEALLPQRLNWNAGHLPEGKNTTTTSPFDERLNVFADAFDGVFADAFEEVVACIPI